MGKPRPPRGSLKKNMLANDASKHAAASFYRRDVDRRDAREGLIQREHVDGSAAQVAKTNEATLG